MLNEVYVKEGNTGAVMGGRLLFVSFTIAPKFMIEKHSRFTLRKCGQNKTQGARLRFPPLPY